MQLVRVRCHLSALESRQRSPALVEKALAHEAFERRAHRPRSSAALSKRATIAWSVEILLRGTGRHAANVSQAAS